MFVKKSRKCGAGMKAVVDRDLCIGCGLCTEICPEVFEMDDEAIAQVIVDVIPAEIEETAREAAASCPVEAIAIED
jgi:ferredoxin